MPKTVERSAKSDKFQKRGTAKAKPATTVVEPSARLSEKDYEAIWEKVVVQFHGAYFPVAAVKASITAYRKFMRIRR